jgi:hypothetical protein
MAETIRYYATSRYAYAWAMLRLVELARTHQGPAFEFGPLTLDALEEYGLVLGGDDLKPVTDLLDRQAGLVKIPE